MIAFFGEKGFCLEPESPFEHQLLKQEKTRSKLAFSQCLPAPAPEISWSIGYGDKFFIDWERRKAGLPCIGRGEDLFRYCFRVLMDRISLREGRLSLHCAFLRHRNSGLFIVAPSGFGKSQLSCALASASAAFRIIGDDHCHIVGRHIQGNSLVRMRGQDGDRYFPALGSADWHAEKSVIVSLEGKEGVLERIAAEDFAGIEVLKAALKYLWEEPRHLPADLDMIMENRKSGQKLFLSFLKRLKGCYRIGSGPASGYAALAELLEK